MAIRIVAAALVLAVVTFVVASFVATPPWHGSAPTATSSIDDDGARGRLVAGVAGRVAGRARAGRRPTRREARRR